MLLVADSFKLIVERDLLALFDVSQRKDADPQLASNPPLLRGGVGIARVVDETAKVALERCIDALAAVERQHVKVLLGLGSLFESLRWPRYDGRMSKCNKSNAWSGCMNE